MQVLLIYLLNRMFLFILYKNINNMRGIIKYMFKMGLYLCDIKTYLRTHSLAFSKNSFSHSSHSNYH